MSNIIGGTATTKSVADKVVAFDSKCAAPNGAPSGLNVECLGQHVNPSDNPGTFGLIFKFSIPAGSVLDAGPGKTGSEGNDKDGFHWFQATIADSPGSTSSEAYVEMWFTDTDAKSNTWSVLVSVVTSKGTYTYTFTKGGSGGGHRH